MFNVDSVTSPVPSLRGSNSIPGTEDLFHPFCFQSSAMEIEKVAHITTSDIHIAFTIVKEIFLHNNSMSNV